MARITKYTIDGTITDSDKLLGTDAESSNATKNYLVGDLADYITSDWVAVGSGTTNYIPLWTPDGNTIGDSIMFQLGVGTSNPTVQVGNYTSSGGTTETVLGAGYMTTTGLFAEQGSFTNITSGNTGVVTIQGNAIIGDAATDILQISSSVSDYTGAASTAAGQVLVSTANGQLVWAPASSGGTVTGTGTTNNLPLWSDGPNGDIGDSQLRQLGPNGSGLYQLRFENADRFIINKPSSVTSGDPEYLITQDGNYKVSMGWDDDGAGFGYLYNYAGDGWRFGSAGNNPELTIVTTAGSEGVDIANDLRMNGNATVSGDLTLENGLIDGDLTYGTAGQVLSTTGAGQNVKWIDTGGGGTAIVPNQRQAYIISVTNKTVGSPDFDTTSLCTNVIYNRQASNNLNWSEYGKQWTPSFDSGYDAGGSFGSSDGVFSMLEESVKDVLATTGNSAVANWRFATISYDNWMLASHEMPLAVRIDNNGASPGNGTALIKLVEEVSPKTGPPNLPSTVCVWFVDTTDTSSNMGGPIPTIVFAGKDTAYAKIVNGGNQYDAGATYTFTGNTGDTTRKYALLIEDEYYSNMRSKYLKVTGGRVVLENLPTSDPSSNGVVWNDSGTLKISAG